MNGMGTGDLGHIYCRKGHSNYLLHLIIYMKCIYIHRSRELKKNSICCFCLFFLFFYPVRATAVANWYVWAAQWSRARARTWKAKRKTLQERKGADSRRNREKRHTANHLYPVLIEPRYASSHNHFFFFYVLIHRQENIVFLAGTNESTTSTTTTIKMLFSIRLLRCYRLNEFLTNIDQSSSLFFFLSL